MATPRKAAPPSHSKVDPLQELTPNDEESIQIRFKQIVWGPDCTNNKRITLLFLLPSGTRSDDISYEIEDREFVLHHKTNKHWWESSLLTDDCGIDSSHHLVQAFRDVSSASSALSKDF